LLAWLKQAFIPRAFKQNYEVSGATGKVVKVLDLFFAIAPG
jgi:hypothetical protein